MTRERADRQRARLKAVAELLLEAARLARLDLVLDGDVRPPGRAGPAASAGRERRRRAPRGSPPAPRSRRGRRSPRPRSMMPDDRRRAAAARRWPRRGGAESSLSRLGGRWRNRVRCAGTRLRSARIMGAPQLLEPAIVAVAEQGGDDDRAALKSRPGCRARRRGWSAGLKNSIALSALRSIQANSFSRQIAMPGRGEAIRVWRARKKLVSIILNCGPQLSTRGQRRAARRFPA